MKKFINSIINGVKKIIKLAIDFFMPIDEKVITADDTISSGRRPDWKRITAASLSVLYFFITLVMISVKYGIAVGILVALYQLLVLLLAAITGWWWLLALVFVRI